MAGAALQGGQQHPDTVDRHEAAAVLTALQRLEVVLPVPLPPDWRLGPVADDRAVVAAAERLAWALDALPHPGEVGLIEGELLHGDQLRDPSAAASFITTTVHSCGGSLATWIRYAQQQLNALGLVVPPAEQQAVALRMTAAAAAIGDQAAAIERGQIPPPVVFPPPPPPTKRSHRFAVALERWAEQRSPALRSRLDAQKRLQDLAAHCGHDDLSQLTAEQVTAWRSALLAEKSAPTVKRHLAMTRAVLAAAADTGLQLDRDALDRLSGRGIRDATGVKLHRRGFSRDELQALILISRQQRGRDLDRWAFPLGLSSGCRLEEMAGLRKSDVTEINGVPVIRVRPNENRRLKNDTSVRDVPLPEVLIAEGFVDWVQSRPDGYLFDEPPPPRTDPRRSHYASIRLSRILRDQAGISDKAAVFHSCRHTVAQQLVDAGVEQRVIEQLLGHSSRSMAARYSRQGLPLERLQAAQEMRYWRWWPAPGG